MLPQPKTSLPSVRSGALELRHSWCCFSDDYPTPFLVLSSAAGSVGFLAYAEASVVFGAVHVTNSERLQVAPGPVTVAP